ncbi:hypothetical protein SK128_007703 [Halocaridina rubra]|uniref:Uncharacterized protein n=1 Tax=Halocaridina rubra TaxID=373956 RepID=A0AAN9A7M5_HALRR
MPYRTIKIGESAFRPKPATFSSSTGSQSKWSVIHALDRLDVNDDRPDANSQPPNKPVVKNVMDKLSTIIAIKHIPFVFLVGDLPAYVLITQLKAANPNNFHDLVSFLRPFYTQCVMMSTIYKHYKGSELEEVLVAGGVIADDSVEHALKGKHYKKGLYCLRFMYEALISQLMQGSLAFDLSDETKKNLEILSDMSQS